MAEEVPLVVGPVEGEVVGGLESAVNVLSKSEVEAVRVDDEGEPVGDSEGVPNGVVSVELLGPGVAHVAGPGEAGGVATTKAGS